LVPAEVREFTSQLGAAKLALVLPEGYRPLAQEAILPLPPGLPLRSTRGQWRTDYLRKWYNHVRHASRYVRQ
jgi:hypothetical protein